MVINRIALVGAPSTGKTTVFELLKNKLPEYTFINESTRTVRKYGFPINEEGEEQTQLAIACFHLHALTLSNNLILDRCMLDVAVYSDPEVLPQLDNRTVEYIRDLWLSTLGVYTHYVYFPIEFKAVDDGVRSINENWRETIDNLFKKYLKEVENRTNNKILTITGSPIQRTKQITQFIKYEEQHRLSK